MLYTSHHADASTPTAASRREAAKLREARRPPAAYGSHVHRRLRGRWFSLVPVRRRTLVFGSALIVSVTLFLCLAHYFAVTRAWLSNHADVARPLRLDHPDSFGQWLICVLLAGSSGASLLIYQLRRYRNDDYRGQYRLWRLVLALLMIASVHSLVGLLDWGGALLDLMLGKRVALSGHDWLRLLVSIGCAILALRLVAEVRRSRWGLVGILVACGCFAIPEAVNWNVMTVESIGRWTLVTSAPLLGCTALFLALVGYLRMLYREVRRIEDESLTVRFQSLKSRLFSSQQAETDDLGVDAPRRRWFALGSQRGPHQDEYESEADSYEDEQYEEAESVEEEHEQADQGSRRKRRWFGRRAAESEAAGEDDTDEPEDDTVKASKPKKRRRWSLRLDPADSHTAADEDEQEASDEPESSERPPRRFGLSWRRKPAAKNDDEPTSVDRARRASAADPDDDEYIDPEEIDWDSLSKSERRRLRKKLKRQRRAA